MGGGGGGGGLIELLHMWVGGWVGGWVGEKRPTHNDVFKTKEGRVGVEEVGGWVGGKIR